MVKVYKSEKGKQEILRTYDILLKKWDVDYEEIDVKTRYGSTHIITAGTKGNPPLILFHGVGDDAAMMWIVNAKSWSEKFRIYAIDTIGGPGKSVPNENYGKGFDQCLWIDDVLDELKLDKVNVAGVSNGAYLTQLYGAKRPNRTIKMVCMAGSLSAGDKDPGLRDMIKTFKIFFPEALFPSMKNAKKLIKKLSGENASEFANDNDVIGHWMALLKHFNNMSMGYHKIISLRKGDVDAIRDKALFIIGDSDPIAYSEESINILKENKMQYQILNNAGHTLNYEMPDEVNELVADFILKD